MDPFAPSTYFATPRETRDSGLISRPLEKVRQHTTVLRRYVVDVRRHVPLALDTPDLVYPDAVLVSERDEKQNGHHLTFTRLFATVPDAWTSASSAVVDLPGISAAPTYAAATTITAIDAKLADVQTITAASHGLTAGDRVRLWVTFEGRSAFGASSKWFVRSGHYVVLTAATHTFTVSLGSVRMDDGGQVWTASSVAGTVAEQTAGYLRRATKTKVVPVSVEHSYYLPGVTLGVRSRKDIALPDIFTIELGTESADTFAANTVGAGTVPTAANYWDMMQRQAELILNVELEEYLGNIIHRKITSYTAR